MKTLFQIAAIFFLPFNCLGQSKPIIFPDQLNVSENLNLKCFCKPGISNQSRSKGIDLSYTYFGNRTYESTKNTSLEAPLTKLNYSTDWSLSIKLPVINQDKFKLLVGYTHNQERYKISRIGDDYSTVFENIDQTVFKNNTLNLYLIKPINQKQYAAIRARVLFSGNYDSFFQLDKQYAYYNIITYWGFKKNEQLEWGFGLSYGRSIDGKNKIIPILKYNRNFSKKWGIETLLPAKVFLRNNVNSKTILLYGVEYSGQDYLYELKTSNQPSKDYYVFDHSSIQLETRLERQLREWIWLNVKVGYNLTFTTEFSSTSTPSDSFDVEPDNHPFFQFGVFISPPKKYMK